MVSEIIHGFQPGAFVYGLVPSAGGILEQSLALSFFPGSGEFSSSRHESHDEDLIFSDGIDQTEAVVHDQLPIRFAQRTKELSHARIVLKQ